MIGYWHAFAESKFADAKVDVQQVIEELWASCDGLAAAPMCYPEMPGTYCIVVPEDNTGIGSKISEMRRGGCTSMNVIESKNYMFDEHRRADPETRLGCSVILVPRYVAHKGGGVDMAGW